MTTPQNAPMFDVTEMTRLGRVSATEPSPCGTWLAAAVSRLDADESKYISDLWRVSLSDPDIAPVKLTRGDTNDASPRFRRDGSLGFLSNRNPRDAKPEPGDTDRMQVWLLPAAGGEPRPITDEPLGVSDFRFSAGADRLCVIAEVLPGVDHNEQRAHAADIAENGPSGLHYHTMPVRHWDHWRAVAAPHLIAYSEDGSGRRDLTPDADFEHRDTGFGVEWDLSADGRRAVIARQRIGSDRIEESALRLVDIDAGSFTDLGVADRATNDSPRFSPDSNSIVCVRHQRQDKRCGKPTLWLFDLASGTDRALAAEWDCWPSPQQWTPDGGSVITTADWRGVVPAFKVDVASGEVTRITSESAGGSHSGLHVVTGDSGSMVVGLRHRFIHPPEPFRVPLSPGSEPTLLACLSGFTPERGASIATWESFSVTGDDGVEIQSFALAPTNRGDTPSPGLVWIHGGPVGQFSDGWHWRWNTLLPVAQGYALALPNPRGSTGFGQEFLEGIWNNEWGGACYRDLMAVTDTFACRDEVDGARIGAMGGSFGGYMANWIGGNTDRFKCLMTHAGIYSMPAFHGTTDYPAYFAMEMGGTPYDDAEAFDRYSPHRFLDTWKTPTLVIHGDNDYRVPVSEALLLFEALQLRGVESELLVYPNENHWILKPRNARQWYESVFAFAANHLKS